MTAKDRLLTEDEAKNIILKGWCSPETTAKDICLEPWIEEITVAQARKILDKLTIAFGQDIADHNPVRGHLVDACRELWTELAELDARSKGKELP